MRLIVLFLLIISQVFEVFAGNIKPETVTVVTDRDIYVAGENMHFNVYIHPGSGNEFVSNICYILLRNTQNTLMKNYLKADSNGFSSAFYLPDTLKTGYYEIVAFTNYMRNFGEEIYFRKQILIVNRFDEWLSEFSSFSSEDIRFSDSLSLDNSTNSIKLTSDKVVYNTREKVNLKIQSESYLKNLSISVKALNPFSLTLLNNTIDLSKYSNYTITSPRYEPEFDKIILYGQVALPNNTPFSNECLFISIPDSIANLQYTFTNEKGEFKFELNEYYMGKQLIINSRENIGDKKIIKLNDKFELKLPFNPKRIEFTANLRKYILESQMIVKVRKAYAVNDLKEISNSGDRISYPYVYLEPSHIIFPSQYIPLNNFIDISNNILEGYRVKVKDSIAQGYNINEVDRHFFDQPGAIFLNGVYLHNLNPVMNFNTADIFKIELCNIKRVKGNINFQGIISINTYQKLDYSTIIPEATILYYNNFLSKVTFKSNNCDNKLNDDPNPDFRQTLYWYSSPDQIPASIHFYTSDWLSDYIVEVNATDREGKPLRSFTIFKVQK